MRSLRVEIRRSAFTTASLGERDTVRLGRESEITLTLRVARSRGSPLSPGFQVTERTFANAPGPIRAALYADPVLAPGAADLSACRDRLPDSRHGLLRRRDE